MAAPGENHDDEPSSDAGGRRAAGVTAGDVSGAPDVDAATLTGHAIIAGFGLSGRSAANALIARNIPICVIERNADTVRRCSIAGLAIFHGDATDEALMRRAGIESAVLFAATMPNDPAVLEAVALARRLNPGIRIVARCEYVSTGMRAERKGADEVVIAEKVVATEFGRAVEREVTSPPPARPSSQAEPQSPPVLQSPPVPQSSPPRESRVAADTP
jgi:voltage-gated potassium channel Kch